MKTKYVYPAIFAPEEVGFSVSFPDLPGCVTEGDTLEEAIDMARDALGLYLSVLEDDGGLIPTASHPADIRPDKNSFVALVDMDMLEYKQKHDNKAIKKTLTIPQWLNTMAEREGINVSNVVQTALKDRLGVQSYRKPTKKKL